MSYEESIQRETDRLITRVTDSVPGEAQRALLRLLDIMNDSSRFVPGARLYDSYIRDILNESYDEA